jgi:predicted lipoprotein with Yx(FWY)xxD motif
MTRSRLITFIAAAAVVPIAAIAALGGGGGGGATATAAAPKTTSARSPTVRVANSRLGKVLVDSRGHTLYLFKRDVGTKSNCTGACAIAWPPLRANGRPTVGSGAIGSKVGATRRSDGTREVTYGTHPLYSFVLDRRPGDTHGEGLTAFGGRWFAVSPSGTQVPVRRSSVNGGIPQSNGGDHDLDNNGGPSDGDGNV